MLHMIVSRYKIQDIIVFKILVSKMLPIPVYIINKYTYLVPTLILIAVVELYVFIKNVEK